MADLVPLFDDQIFPRRLRRLMEEPFWARGEVDEGSLALDVYKDEDANAIVAKASLPGFSKDEIDVHIEDGVLSISGEHSEVKEEQKDRYYRRERRVGHVHRRVALPGPVKEAEAAAELADGVLTVRVPIAAEAKAKRVDVKLT